MDEKWRLALWAAAAAKDMEFAATQRSAIPFVEEGLTFFDKLSPRLSPGAFLYIIVLSALSRFHIFSGALTPTIPRDRAITRRTQSAISSLAACTSSSAPLMRHTV